MDTKKPSRKAIPIDARVVALDETANYDIGKKYRRYIKAIRGVYLYDKNEVTHCCEFTPSYWLIHLYDQVVLTKAGEKLGDCAKDEIYQEYEHCGGENIYIHCSHIDAVESGAKPLDYRYHVYGATGVGYKDSSHDDQMEGLREHFCANCPL